ncbi:ABC-2 type transporter-domain-containing protein [Polychytrium aggregatum]|uniref:ABC-2 type transporter-domain-containing protein n=1 Tax=Polychytrium aggregatum TaxID=110093 RepID=UPI0022FE7055|nr:ABC-2 type transporter-domain-containing protein [Polychytrium aggregatum]KAI9208487.1 ABC-2 type transporter-domain-containing protein [Polychytrium aggregatum]
MSGEVKSGEVVAIMGGSGAGKSSLLNVLAGRIANVGKLSGSILVNGREREAKKWRNMCAYVEQDDVMFRNLTVYETIMFSAQLRLPRTWTHQQRHERVIAIIQELGLLKCKDTIIGDTIRRGISGGERKRVSIAIELVNYPSILFLDEPTSGLDAFTAFNIVETIKKLATQHNWLVVMTIHQPRTDIMDLLDKVILLSVGKTLWMGTTAAALMHFDELGYHLPDKTNPSDFFMDIITLDQRTPELSEQSQSRIEKFQQAWETRRTRMNTNVPSEVGIETPVDRLPPNWFRELGILLRRNLQEVSRDKATLGATFGQGIIMMLFMGFIYFKVTLDSAGAQNRGGVLFFMCINQTFGVVMPSLPKFIEQREIIKRERASGAYRASAAYIAKVISTWPQVFIGVLILALPVYWMVGLQPLAANYFTFLLILVVHSNVANALGLMMGSASPNLTVAQIIGPLTITIFLLFGGQLLNLDNVPVVFRWIQWISIISYSNKALNQNEFSGLTFNMCSANITNPGPTCFTSGDYIVQDHNLNNPDKWMCILANVIIGLCFLILGYAFFQRTSRPLQRLS